VHVSKTVLVWTLLIAAVMAPVAEVVAFGIHEHTSVPNASGAPTGNGSDPGRSHHCEFWMSLGTVPVVQDFSPLAQVAALDAAPAPRRGSPTLSVPVPPPRS